MTSDTMAEAVCRPPSFTGGAGARSPREQVREPVVLAPGRGRCYRMGPLRALFKADGDETRSRYAVAEWWLDAHTEGPGAHVHPQDDAFYVLQGIVTFLVDGERHELGRGGFLIVPGGVVHHFENRHASTAGVLNFTIPGGCEMHMPDIAQWLRDCHATRDAGYETRAEVRREG